MVGGHDGAGATGLELELGFGHRKIQWKVFRISAVWAARRGWVVGFGV